MTRDEFIDGYMTRSGIPSDNRTEFGFFIGSHDRFALPCNCGDEGCVGWKMVPAAIAAEELIRAAE